MRATYHQPFAKQGPLYPFKVEEIGLGLENAGKFRASNVLNEKVLGVFESQDTAEAAITSEVQRVNDVAGPQLS